MLREKKKTTYSIMLIYGIITYILALYLEEKITKI